MTWNNIAMAQRFLQQANNLHPEEATSKTEHARQTAEQTLLYECYMSCFSREKLVEMLHRTIEKKFEIPEDTDPAIFSEAYVAKARHLLEEFTKTQ